MQHSFIDQVKESNDILSVAQELIPGLKKTSGAWVGTIRNEKTPALTIYPNTQSWYHYAGDETPRGRTGGDVIDLVELVKQCTFWEAVQFLASRAGVPLPKYSKSDEKKYQAQKMRDTQKAQALELLMQTFEQANTKGIEYLESRGISREVSQAHRVGYANLPKTELTELLKDFDTEITQHWIEQHWFFKDSLIIPIITGGNIVSLYSRSNTRDPQYKHLYLKGCPKGIFNYDQASKHSKETTYITEAPIDALTLISQGLPSVVAVGGTQVADKQAKLLERLGDNLVICFDNDEDDEKNSGRNAAIKLMRKLGKAKFKQLPAGDVNDYFQERSVDDFHNLDELRLWEIFLNDIPEDTDKVDLRDELDIELIPLLVTMDEARRHAILTSAVKERFSLTSRDIESYERVLRKQAKEYEKKKQEVVIEDVPEKPQETFDEETQKQALALLSSPTLLHDILLTIKQNGVVGEEMNALTHYMTLTSRLLKNPMSVVVKGDSSAGKSFVLLGTLKLFPKSAYKDLTDATTQSFFYTPEDDLKHRIIIIFEKHGSEKADYTIRTLQSEGKLKIQVTVKDPDTGQFISQEIEKEGPTGFITTTTDSLIHDENDTRVLSIFPDQTSTQTTRVYEANEARYLGKKKPSEDLLKTYRCAQTQLKQIPVLIPFVMELREHFPSNILRTRRDHGRFLSVIETSALLHQYQRETVKDGEQAYIRATLADYEIARVLVEESLSKSIYELPPRSIDVVEAAYEVTAANNDYDSEESEFTTTDLAGYLKWDGDTIRKWLKPAVKKGYVNQTQKSRGNKGAKYRIVSDKELPGSRFLPTAYELSQKLTSETLGGIYSPITGEKGVCTDEPTPPTEEKNTHDIPAPRVREKPPQAPSVHQDKKPSKKTQEPLMDMYTAEAEGLLN